MPLRHYRAGEAIFRHAHAAIGDIERVRESTRHDRLREKIGETTEAPSKSDCIAVMQNTP